MVAACRLSLVAEQELLFTAVCRLLPAVASLVVEHGLERVGASVAAALGLRICGTWTELLHCMWDMCRPGIEPMSPAYS